MTRLAAPELALLTTVAENCDCCPVVCCGYGRVQIAWTVTASADRTVGSVTDEIDWSISLNMTWNREDNSSAPTFPKTFRVADASDIERCELVPNGGPFEHTIDGSYTYVQTTSGVGETDREEVDLTPWLSQFHLRINCNCESLEYAGTNHPVTGEYIPLSDVSMYLVGDPSTPSSLPSEWGSYFVIKSYTFDDIGDVTPCQATKTTIATNELSGWDSSSRTDVVSIIITRSEDL